MWVSECTKGIVSNDSLHNFLIIKHPSCARLFNGIWRSGFWDIYYWKKTKYMHRHTLTERRKWHLDGNKAKIGRTHAAKTVKWVKSRKKSTTHKFHSKLAANGKIMDICAATIPKWNHFLFGSLRVGLNELLCLFSVWFWQTTTTTTKTSKNMWLFEPSQAIIVGAFNLTLDRRVGKISLYINHGFYRFSLFLVLGWFCECVRIVSRLIEVISNVNYSRFQLLCDKCH